MPPKPPSPTQPKPTPALLTVAQAAGRCQVAVRTVRRWIAADELPVLQFGRAVRIVESELEHFMRKARR